MDFFAILIFCTVGVSGNIWSLPLLLTCDNVGYVDPCLPGGKYDPLVHECRGSGDQTCFGCYEGDRCTKLNKECSLDSGSGNPSLFTEYWENNQNIGCSQTPADYRTLYQFAIDEEPIIPLAEAIRKLHAQVGNAETKGYEIVIGYGSTSVINAVMSAISRKSKLALTKVVSKTPVYPMYFSQADSTTSMSDSGVPHLISFETCDDQNITDPNIYEFVTHPNNPDGALRQSSSKYPGNVVYDLAYYWPNFLTIPEKLKHDIMVFTTSKLTGHAGSRFGWALVKDKQFANYMRDYINLQNIGVSIDTQIRMMNIFQYLTAQSAPLRKECQGFSHEYFCFAHHKMKNRFKRLKTIFEKHSDSGFELSNSPSHGAYAWIKCPSGHDCFKTFQIVKVNGISGFSFHASPEYVRLQLMMRSVEIDDLFERVDRLLSNFHFVKHKYDLRIEKRKRETNPRKLYA